jgi:prepilin-type N-terminal cleavage/methylation domain-containing protein
MAPDRRSREAGFTLIEVLLALMIGALVVLLARQLVVAVADGSHTLLAARARLDRASNARRWLAATFLSLDMGTDSARGFAGRADRVDFTAWERTVDDWFERRYVTLGLDGSQLVATVLPGHPVVLMDSLDDVAWDYLLEPGAESRWVREWISAVSAPIAIRLRVTRKSAREQGAALPVDTLLFLIKERG